LPPGVNTVVLFRKMEGQTENSTPKG
jgi:hypothetical protein